MRLVRYCSSCGHQNPGSADFCNSCGQPVSAPLQPPIVSRRPSSRLGAIGMVFGIIGVLCAFIPWAGMAVAFICAIIGIPLCIVGSIRNRRLGLYRRITSIGIILNCVAVVLAFVISFVFFIRTSDVYKSFEEMTCEDIIDDVIDLSKEKGEVEFLKIYSYRQTSKSSTLLECEGQVDVLYLQEPLTGPKRIGLKGVAPIKFRLEKEADGVVFVGYQIDILGSFD